MALPRAATSARPLAPAPAPAPAPTPSPVKRAAALLNDKDAEIERLNAECIELEDEAAALKKEVQAAWNTYKSAQEAAAARE